MGIPFIPVRGAVSSDYMRIRKDFRLVDDPYHPGEKTVVVPAMVPDVALLHGFRGDRYGNVVLWGRQDARLTAMASRHTIVTVEEIVDGPLTAGPGELVLTGIHVSAVVHAPFGAHPSACEPYYLEDLAHLQEYMDAAESPVAFEAYLDRYVRNAPRLADYLAAVGLFDTSPAPTGAA